jgi:hypothetical protein
MKEITRVIKNRILIGALAASAALVPIAGVSALSGVEAGATTPTGITCTSGSGPVDASTFTATINFSGCTGKTGGSGTTTDSQGQTSGTVTWAKTPKTTTFTLKSTTGTKCDSSALADEVLKGKVTADKTKSTAVGAKVKGEFCVDSDSSGNITISLAPGTKFTIAG